MIMRPNMIYLPSKLHMHHEAAFLTFAVALI